MTDADEDPFADDAERVDWGLLHGIDNEPTDDPGNIWCPQHGWHHRSHGVWECPRCLDDEARYYSGRRDRYRDYDQY